MTIQTNNALNSEPLPLLTEQIEILLSRKEAAKILDVQPGTLAVWECTKRYKLPVTRVGRLCKYKPSDLKDFIKSQQKGGNDE